MPVAQPTVPERIVRAIVTVLVAIRDLIAFIFLFLFNLIRAIVGHPVGRIVLLVIVVALLIFGISTSVSRCSQGEAPEQQGAEQQSAPQAVAYDPTPESVSALQVSSSGTVPVTLNGARADVVPQLSDNQNARIEEVIESYTSNERTVGFLFVNLKTGMALARDIDSEVYAASSIKGPYAAYVCSLIDDGQISRDTQCANTWNVDSGSTRTEESYSVESLVSDMIIWSDNNALRFLRASYDSLGFEDYLASMNADPTIMDEKYFAHYSTRTSAVMWMRIYQYLKEADTNENAAWLAELMSETEISFIRNGVEQAGMDAVVYNKGGWCTDEDDSGPEGDYNGMCDSAIIFERGVPYLLTIMTDTPYTEPNVELFSDMAAALLDARWALDDQAQRVMERVDTVTSNAHIVPDAFGKLFAVEQK